MTSVIQQTLVISHYVITTSANQSKRHHENEINKRLNLLKNSFTLCSHRENINKISMLESEASSPQKYSWSLQQNNFWFFIYFNQY